MPLDVKDKIFARCPRPILSVDIHSPWLIAGCGLHPTNKRLPPTINIYNLESGSMTYTLNISTASSLDKYSYNLSITVLCVKFIARKNWFAASTSDGMLCVFGYDAREEVTTFQAHDCLIRCLAVHPTIPIVLTGGDDGSLRAWDWGQQWGKVQEYEGSYLGVTAIAFHPKDSSVFASGFWSGIVKVWSIASPIAKFSVNAHSSFASSVEFCPGTDKPYLITSGRDKTIKIWDYISQTCIQSMKNHSDFLSFALYHPNLPFIISGGGDGVINIWCSRTYNLERMLTYNLDQAQCIAFRPDTNQVVVGFQKGIVILELEDREPDVFMDHSGKPLSSNDDKTPDTTIIVSASTGAGTPLKATEINSREVFTGGSDTVNGREAAPYQQCTVLAMEIMKSKATNKLISELTDSKAQDMVDFLSKMVDDEGSFTQRERRRTLQLLSKLAKSAQVFPLSLELQDVQCNLLKPVAAGGYGFIYKGEYEGSVICIKAVHVDAEGISRRKMRAHASELIIWAHIFHSNVLPFFGIYYSDEEDSRICIVSPWMTNGDLLQYLKKVPEVPRKPLVRDIISGLQYLHDFDIIHADLKAKNVLVSECGKTMLADFGISRLSMTLSTILTNAGTGTAYWMAPELLVEDKLPSRESDIWAFACTCYEIITGMVPFNECRSPPLLIAAFMRGKLTPNKPTPGIGWDEDVWSIAMRCWRSDSASRPGAHELLNMINGFNFQDDRSLEPQSQRKRRSSNINYDRILSILYEIRWLAAV